MPNDRRVVLACYLGCFILAMVVNLTPLLFIPIRREMGLTFEQLGRLVLINFTTQMLVDLVCCALADRMPTKILAVSANLLGAVGLWLFAFSPAWFANPYDGLVLGTVVFSVGCGLLEVLLSPIINAVPSEQKERDMALLHAFYPIGKVSVILVTGTALALAGIAHWRTIMVAWTIAPLLNTLGFATVKLPQFAPEGRRQTLRELVRYRTYMAFLAAILFAGATEVTIAQWASAYAEVGLGLSKTVADLLGFGLFSLGMIVGRLWFGFRGQASNLQKLMLTGAAFSAVCYLVISLAGSPVLALAACGFAGFFVSMLWPGTVSLAAARFPLAGASMFAMLAAFGDFGAGAGPWLTGVLTDHFTVSPPTDPILGGVVSYVLGGVEHSPEQIAMRLGLLCLVLCPIAMALIVWRLKVRAAGATKDV